MVATLKSHLIVDRERFGIAENDYDAFILARSREIARQLNKKLDPFENSDPDIIGRPRARPSLGEDDTLLVSRLA